MAHGPPRLKRSIGSSRVWIWIAAVAGPIAVALLLVPSRSHLSAADDALVLVVVVVAIALVGSSGRRHHRLLGGGGLVRLSPDPPLRLIPDQSPIRHHDGDPLRRRGTAGGGLAARGRQHQEAAALGRLDLSRLHDLGERIAGGEDPDFVLIAVASELRELLSLQDCRFVRDQPSGKGAWIANDGTVRLNPLRWPSSTMGLPTKQVELPVRGGGRVLGTFILTPTPAAPVSQQQCVVAVALVDQLGAALAAREGN